MSGAQGQKNSYSSYKKYKNQYWRLPVPMTNAPRKLGPHITEKSCSSKDNHADIYIQSWIHKYKHNLYLHTWMNIKTYIHAFIRTYIHICTHTCMHTYIHMYIHTCVIYPPESPSTILSGNLTKHDSYNSYVNLIAKYEIIFRNPHQFPWIPTVQYIGRQDSVTCHRSWGPMSNILDPMVDALSYFRCDQIWILT